MTVLQLGNEPMHNEPITIRHFVMDTIIYCGHQKKKLLWLAQTQYWNKCSVLPGMFGKCGFVHYYLTSYRDQEEFSCYSRLGLVFTEEN